MSDGGNFGPFWDSRYNLKFTITPPPVEIVEHTFSIDITYKKPCDCGAEKANTTHAEWCSRKP